MGKRYGEKWMSRKIRLGVIGLGMGRHHARGFKNHPDAELAALCDSDKVRLDELGNELSVAGRYATAEEMFAREKLDAVAIATPNKFHKPLTMMALKHGCHVLCEKPMAMNAGEAREMLAAAKKAGKHLMINFSYRFTE